MKIKFKQDYRGVLTKDANGDEHYFEKGKTIDLSKKEYKAFDGESLIADGRAKATGLPTPKKKAKNKD